MQHFKNYLDETHPDRDAPAHLSPAHAAGGGGEDGAGVYVRKWMRTRHAVIFRLSNNSFQVPPRPPAPRFAVRHDGGRAVRHHGGRAVRYDVGRATGLRRPLVSLDWTPRLENGGPPRHLRGRV